MEPRSELLRVISLGAGVQSTTVALLAKHGEITPMPDCAIFADTHSEPAAVYRHLEWLERELPFPVHHASAGSLRQHILDAVAGARFAGAPFHTKPLSELDVAPAPVPDPVALVQTLLDAAEALGAPEPLQSGLAELRQLALEGMLDGEQARNVRNAAKQIGGMLRRQCTREFKIAPIQAKERELLGAKAGENIARHGVLIEQWIGISLDEVQRMKPSLDKWKVHRWPLIDLRMTRGDCLQWLKKHGYPRPPRSACTFCPYHSDDEWRALKADPVEWEGIVALDRLIRGGVRGTHDPLYLHRSLKPIDEVDLSTAEDHGQLSMFGNECEGMCGV